jgi:hypothetical protein
MAKAVVLYKRLIIGEELIKGLRNEVYQHRCEQTRKQFPKMEEEKLNEILESLEITEEEIREQILWMFTIWGETTDPKQGFTRSQLKMLDSLEDTLKEAIETEKKPFFLIPTKEFDFLLARWNAFNGWKGGKESRMYIAAISRVLDEARPVTEAEAKRSLETGAPESKEDKELEKDKKEDKKEKKGK